MKNENPTDNKEEQKLEDATDNLTEGIMDLEDGSPITLLSGALQLLETDSAKIVAEGWSNRINSKVNLEKVRLEKQESLEKVRLSHQKEQQQKNIKHATTKYWQDIVMVVIILFAIGLLALTQNMGQATVGTLVGTIIGYALGRFRN